MRTFIAIDLPETIRTELGKLQAAFRAASSRLSHQESDTRWTRQEGIHLTLKFLGEVPNDRVHQITEALAALGPIEKFQLEVKGFGFFPNARRPYVLWVGVEAPPALGELAKRVEDAMEKLGFAREARPFTPHLTLARFKMPRPQPALQERINQAQERSLGRFEVSEFFLFESKLSSAGAEYHKVAHFPR